jgi:hypothetical protein
VQHPNRLFLKLAKITGFILAGICALVALLWWGCGPHQPSDQSLELQFKEQRVALERLVAMSDEDWQMARIAPDFLGRQDNGSWPRPESDWGISTKRWNDYREIFTEAHIQDGLTRREKSSDILIGVWSWGIVPAGVSLDYLHCGLPKHGYTHTERACFEQKESGSGLYGSSKSYGYRYKKISEDWFILEESN